MSLKDRRTARARVLTNTKLDHMDDSIESSEHFNAYEAGAEVRAFLKVNRVDGVVRATAKTGDVIVTITGVTDPHFDSMKPQILEGCIQHGYKVVFA